jgi:hypothetical protein
MTGVLFLIPPLLSADETPPRVVAPKADRNMECACEQLKSAPAFSVMADISYDDVLRDDDDDVSGEFDHNPWL